MELNPNTQKNTISFQLDAFLIHVINKSWPNKVFIHASGTSGMKLDGATVYTTKQLQKIQIYSQILLPKRQITMAQPHESPPNCQVSVLKLQSCVKYT